MAKIKVGVGFGKLAFETALQRANPGDLILLDPGHYDVGTVSLQGIGLQGSASPDQVEVRGTFEVIAHCTFTNLTIRALAYDNAIRVRNADAMASITSCVVQSEASGKFPGIWCGGTLVSEGLVALSEPDQTAVNIDATGTLHATNSRLGRLGVFGGKADLIDSVTDTIELSDGARLNSFGWHWCSPAPGKRVFTVSGQSVCEFPNLRLGSDYDEGYAHDSIVQIGNLTQDEGGSFAVLIESGARVLTTDPEIKIEDLNAPPEPATVGPQTLEWEASDSGQFSKRIAPFLKPGDTVLLGHGEYSLDDYDSLFLGANLVGQGPENTRVTGSIGALTGRIARVSDLTICAPSAHRNAVVAVQADAQLCLENVSIESTQDASAVAVYVEAGTVEFERCNVIASGDLPNGIGQVLVLGGARFDAADSELGWLHAGEGAEVTVSNSTSFGLYASGGAAIMGTGEHGLHANESDQYELSATDGGSIRISHLVTGSDDPYVRLDGGNITIDSFGRGPEEKLSVHRVRGEFDGIPNERIDLYDRDENEDWVLVTPHGSASDTARENPVGRVNAPGNGLGSGVQEQPHSGRASAAHPPGDPLGELQELAGLAQVKQQVRGFVNAVKVRQKREEAGLPTDDGFTLHSMFLGNPGTGKTTVARLVGEAMYRAGVVESESFIEVGRAQLVSENIGGTAKQTRKLLESGQGGVIFIDEAYSLASEDSAGFAQEAVTEILTFMENHRSDTMVILAGYTDKMHDLLAVNEGLKSRVKHRFDFEDYSPEEIAEIGLNELARGHYEVNQTLYRRIIASSYRMSADRSNARWVRNFNQDLRSLQGDRVIQIADPTREDLVTIRDSDLHAFAGGDPASREQRLAEKLAELDSLVGLIPVKQWVRSLVQQAEVNRRTIEFDGESERPAYHVAFTGNPGTGKTTVARIIGEIFYALGILATPTVQTFAASQLIGKFLGHSSDNTHRAFDAAMGGVLFIDEAHQLRSGSESNSQLRQEVVDAMITRLEDDRDKFIAIFAGYTAEMHEFFASDPGLKDRIPAEIEFPDYTPAEVAEIATGILASKWKLNMALCAEVAENSYSALPQADRGNGRWARKFAEAVVAGHNRYLIEHDIRGEELKTIQDEVLLEFRTDRSQ